MSVSPVAVSRPRFGRGLIPALFGLAVLSLLAVVAPPAQAAITHVHSDNFAVGTSPRSVAIDHVTGDVYVLRTNGGGLTGTTMSIMRFDSSGTPKDFPLLEENLIDACCIGNEHPDGPGNINGIGGNNAHQIAIDNSAGPNQGTIYLATQNQSSIWAWQPSGRLITRFSLPISDPWPNPNQTGPFCGVGVDSTGAVYGAHTRRVENPARGYVDKYAPKQWDPFANPQQELPVKSSLFNLDQNTCRLTVDSTKAVYLRIGQGVTSTGVLKKYPGSLFNVTQPIGQTIDTGVREASVDLATDEVYAAKGSVISRFSSTGELLEQFGTGDLVTSAGVAVNPATGTVYASDLNAGDIEVYEAAVTPDIDDVSAETGQTTAAISATIGTAGAGDVTICEVEYGPTQAYGSTVPCEQPLPYTDATAVTAEIDGLSIEQAYQFRIRATNANGTTLGSNGSFSTHAVQGLATDAPSEVTRTSATLNGSFTGNGDGTTYQFEWGTSPAYGNVTPVEDAGSAVGLQQVSAELTGLDVYTPASPTYHYRLVATNSAGTTFGQDRTFNTLPPAPPLILGTAASSVTPTSATVSAQVNPGLGDTLSLFEYGPSPALGQQTALSDSVGADESLHPIEEQLTGLQPGTTYFYRAVAFNFGGATSGPLQTFSTPDVPGVAGTGASGVTQTAAVLEAALTPRFSPTTYHFEYGAGAGLGSRTPESAPFAPDNVQHAASATVGGLSPDTVYHFRVVATNAVGTTTGPTQTLRTAPATTSPGPDPRCAALARRARSNSARAKRLRRQARRAGNARRARAMRRKAATAVRSARKLSRQARTCRQSSGRKGS